MDKDRIKEYCQLCLKLQASDHPNVAITREDQENFFKLTQKELNTKKFCKFVCDSCVNEFINVVKYRENLINNQKKLISLDSLTAYATVIKQEPDSETETFDWSINVKADVKVEAWRDEPDVDSAFVDVNVRCESSDKPLIAKIAKRRSPRRRTRKRQTNEKISPEFPGAKKQEVRLEPPMICDQCGKEYHFRSRFVIHLRHIHRGDSAAVCHVCAKTFQNRINLRKHLLTHQTEEEKKYQCERCSKRFNDRNNYRRHLRHHDGIKTFICHVCSKGFVQKTTLDAHLNVHNKIRFKCELCPRDFSFQKYMKDHMVKCALGIANLKTRRGINPQKRIQPVYNCYAEGCTRKFSVREHLGRHLERIHKMDIKHFDVTCHICQKVSASSGDHLIHMKIHTCNFRCDLCQVRCKTAEALSTHMENRHKDGEQERTFLCEEPDCGARFKNMGHLRSHNILKHSTSGPRFECEFCKKRFHQRYILNAHLKIHTNERPFSCWQCEFTTASSSRLRIHMTSMHNERKIYKCGTCDQAFAFQRDFLAHEKEHQ